jgi:hypothetical protein
MTYKIAFYFLLLLTGCRFTDQGRVSSEGSKVHSENSKKQTINPQSDSGKSDFQSDNNQLIFQSGFEPDTKIINQNSKTAEIVGKDFSFRDLNSWKTDLEGNSKIGQFKIQYQGGNWSQRLAEITQDPFNSSNKVLKFWIKEPNVDISKGRIQANIYRNKNIREMNYSVRLLIPTDFNNVKNAPFRVKWLTLMEFWNNANWQAEKYQYRMTVNLQKWSKKTDSLKIGIRSQIRDDKMNRWRDPQIWEYINSSYAVPIGKWMKLDIHFVEGDDTTGRLVLSITPDGGETTIIHDIRNFTHHPDDPNPDGLSHFNPMKLYTSDDVINHMQKAGGLLSLYWDDFRISIPNSDD